MKSLKAFAREQYIPIISSLNLAKRTYKLRCPAQMTLMVSHNDSFVTLSPLCPPVTIANAPLCCHNQDLEPNTITIVT